MTKATDYFRILKIQKWITSSPCSQRDQSNPSMSTEDGQTLAECQKVKIQEAHACYETLLSLKDLVPPMRWLEKDKAAKTWPYDEEAELLQTHQDICAKQVPLTLIPSSKTQTSPAAWTSTNSGRLKFKVTFPVTEICRRSNTQSKQMKQLQWAKWNVGQRLKPKKSNNCRSWWLWKTKLSLITESGTEHKQAQFHRHT